MTTPGFKIVIPARYASSRLPGKPLKLIAGKPMIQHTYERAIQCQAEEVIIATDDQRIVDVASDFCQNVMLTSTQHASGTERLAEVVQQKGWDDDTIIVNVQGDEPLVNPAHIEQVAEALKLNQRAGMATLATPITALHDVFDSNVVKVVMDVQGYALYFSRAVIPWARDSFTLAPLEQHLEQQKLQTLLDDKHWFRHIGMYAYRAAALRQYMNLSTCMLEKIESLEQLRMLYHGIAIHVSLVQEQAGHGVDVPADLKRLEQFFKSEHN